VESLFSPTRTQTSNLKKRKMKHPVIVRVKKPKRFVHLGLGSTYKDPKDKGRRKTLKDINGEVMEFNMSTPSIVFDISDDYDKSVYTWLKNHPSIDQHLIFEDTIQQEMVSTEKMVESAEAIQIAVAMTDKQILDFCKLTGIRTKDNSIEFVKAQVIKLANDNPNKFSRIINDRDKDYRVFIENAIDAKLINFVNGTYKYNTETIGLTEDQVVLWLKDNKDIHALLRKEMSGNKKVKAKK
tara:strand:- start:1358 stop:2077 length:720 start_codon:yes stop_codon:yes gene_type:complete